MSSTISKNTPNQGKSSKTTSKTHDGKVLEIGPLEDKFPCSRSKILDFLIVFDDYDYSISDIARYSGISFKTALNETRQLEEDKFITRTRTSGKSIMYKLNPDSANIRLISKLAKSIAISRVKSQKK